MSKNPEVTITMTTGEEIKIELLPEKAENTVRNFIELAEAGYYDGLKFHRVIPGFMVQGGCPDGTGMGNPGYAIKGEFSSNGYDNDLAHQRGIISMARSAQPDSAGSQFFIMHQDAPHLDGQYAAFGQVISGLEVVDQIAAVETDHRDMPKIDQIMETVTVETFDQEYEPAAKIN
ncbi:peptidylprolyl isomerase [Halanaerobium salsuginis]|uniref:Peptidyl-prolyl cis-trans isomerase n=1 Tax=Halanaerobium salsuginis TaxID=29563 RepID=A0A1I4EN88_9FIRM|nr:peptidylprolyl isomerase [Halanaerobium salsuginis]SFL07198.1 peptidyl-prolyl cis-trans isomerase B (cyclophilin B) [Halanaerobium salsuginis]